MGPALDTEDQLVNVVVPNLPSRNTNMWGSNDGGGTADSHDVVDPDKPVGAALRSPTAFWQIPLGT